MLRVAGVNQEDRYHSAIAERADLAGGQIRRLAYKQAPDRTFADYELAVEVRRGPLRSQQSDPRSALSDRSLFETRITISL